MAETAIRPKSLSTLRSYHLREALDSVAVFSAAALVFWTIKFGTAASPSVPQLLITVMLPVVFLKEFYLYTSAVKRLGFIEVPDAAIAGT